MTTRRDLLLALAILLGSPTALAQQPTARIAYLGPGNAKTYGVILDGLKEGLRENGLTEGKDYVLDVRWAEGRYERFPAMVDELLRFNPRVIVPGTIAAVRAAQRATSTIPIVMPSINDPVGAGLIASLARPGGNITGVATLADDVTPKLIDLLREIVPQEKRVAIIFNPDNPSNRKHLDSARIAAAPIGVQIEGFELRDPRDIDSVFAELLRQGFRAVLISRDGALLDWREELSATALKNRIPAVGPQPEYAGAGALIGYGSSPRDNYRRSAIYVKKILAGANPADLPVEQPTLLVLWVNMKTARSLGIVIPHTVILRADRVIE
jgi:putative ABC transport system substrate-binding protein